MTDSFQEINEITMAYDERTVSSQILHLYHSKDYMKFKNLVKTDSVFAKTYKFTLLLFAILWEDKNTVKSLYLINEKHYVNQLKLTKSFLMTGIYTPELCVLLELSFIECFLNYEYNLLKEIFSNANNLFTLTESSFIRIVKDIPITKIYEIQNIGIKYFQEHYHSLKHLDSDSILDSKGLLKIVCKAKLSLMYNYLFITNHYNLKEAICELIKMNCNKLISLIISQHDISEFDFDRYFKIAAKYQNIKFFMIFQKLLEHKR